MCLEQPSFSEYLHIADTVNLEDLICFCLRLIAPYGLLSCRKCKRFYRPVLDLPAVGRAVTVENNLPFVLDRVHKSCDVGGIFLLRKDPVCHDLSP